MSRLENFIKEYADNAGIILNELGPGLAAPPLGGDPMMGAPGLGGPPMGPPMGPPGGGGPTSTVPGKLDAMKQEEEVLSSDKIVEFAQNIKDALGIDPSNLDAAQKGDAFSEDITPENAKSQLAILRNIISQKTDPTEVETD